MLPRQVRRIGEVERAVIHERYMEIGPIWDMIANDIVRHERFRDIPGIFPANVQELYANVGNRRAARRRLRDFIAREQRE
jgi:hypothetical protein